MSIEHAKRIREFIKTKNLTIKAFCKTTGIPESTLKNLLSTNGIPSMLTLKKIKDTYPDFNMEWAVMGDRNVINNSTLNGIISTGDNHTSINGGVSVGNDTTSKLSDNEQRILLLEEKVLHLEEMLREKERVIQILLKNS